MSEKVFKTREVIEREFAGLPEIDPAKVIAISDFDHKENWCVEKRWWDDKYNLKRETIYHTPDKEDAIKYAARYNKDKKSHVIGKSKYNENEHWYEVTFGYPYFDTILRSWSKHAITKWIPFDAKIRLIIHEGIIPPIAFFDQKNEAEQIKMKKAFEDTLMYLNMVDFVELPEQFRNEIYELVAQINQESSFA